MQIVINHLTRMQPGFFCSAGLELTTGLHIRPLIEGGLHTELLSRERGPFSLGAILDLGPTKFIGRVPEIEDRLFERANLKLIGQMDPSEFRQSLESCAKDSLTEIFGKSLRRAGSTRTVCENGGLVSLGCGWAGGCKLIIVQREGGPRLKLTWQDQGDELLTAVADIRLFDSDHRTLNMAAIERANKQLSLHDRTLLSLGLSRSYRKTDNESPMHWLQVNNIFW